MLVVKRWPKRSFFGGGPLYGQDFTDLCNAPAFYVNMWLLPAIDPSIKANMGDESMRATNRREFLADVGKGMLIAGLGPALAADLGLARVSAATEAGSNRLNFGALEPLVALMQETPLDRLLPALVEKQKAGTDLRTLTAAGALANARTFGGHDYIGFHTIMALVPAYEMAQRLPTDRQALPILKVLYRNTSRIQAFGGVKQEILHPVEPGELPAGRDGGELLQAATRKADFEGAERTFAALAAKQPAGEAFNHLQFAVQDEVDVHRVVLAWRSWALLDLTGKEQAHTLLRQSVRYAVRTEQSIVEKKRKPPEIRTLLPKLLDQYKLVGRSLGKRQADDAWVEHLSQTIYGSSPAQAAEAAAAALAEGMVPEAVAEAMVLAANRLVLCDQGRPKEWAQDGKPIGSCHGDSVGVHASDSANAWRHIAQVSNQRNVVASLIVGAYHTAGQLHHQNKDPYPMAEQLEKVKAKDAAGLLKEAEGAICDKDQFHACATVHRYGELGHDPKQVFNLLLRYAISEEGALHAEKYYQTVNEEFAFLRPAFRWRELAALARVTTSEYGYPARGYAEACKLLRVS